MEGWGYIDNRFALSCFSCILMIPGDMYDAYCSMCHDSKIREYYIIPGMICVYEYEITIVWFIKYQSVPLFCVGIVFACCGHPGIYR